jgi:hypothetical protein
MAASAAMLPIVLRQGKSAVGATRSGLQPVENSIHFRRGMFKIRAIERPV